MKKAIFLFTIFVSSLVYAQKQGFAIGAHFGIPSGDISDSHSLNMGADISYNWVVAPFFRLGILTGFDHFIGENNVSDASFLPVAATASYNITSNLFIGADLGYGFGLAPDSNDGGLMFQSRFGYSNRRIDFFLYYRGYTVDNSTFAAFGLGGAVKL